MPESGRDVLSHRLIPMTETRIDAPRGPIFASTRTAAAGGSASDDDGRMSAEGPSRGANYSPYGGSEAATAASVGGHRAEGPHRGANYFPYGGSEAATAASVGGHPPALISSLRQLARLRDFAIVGQAVAIALAASLGVALPVASMMLIVAAELAMNVYAARRIRRGNGVTHREVASQLAFDLAAFTGLLLLAGGAANPFALLYLPHVVLIALLLPTRAAAVGTFVVISCFGIAYAFASPLRYVTGDEVPDAVLTLGLWASFALSALVTAWFIGRIVADLRTHDRLLHEAARRELNDAALLRMGTLAAGAAHELGTPLMTMAVVAGEIAREADTPARQRDAAILVAQVDACRLALGHLADAAGHVRTAGGGRAPLDRFLATIVARFRATRPDVPLDGALGRNDARARNLRRRGAPAGNSDPAQQRGRRFAASCRDRGQVGREHPPALGRRPRRGSRRRVPRKARPVVLHDQAARKGHRDGPRAHGVDARPSRRQRGLVESPRRRARRRDHAAAQGIAFDE